VRRNEVLERGTWPVIRPFDVLRVNGNVVNADGEVTAERANEWRIWAHVKVQEDLRYLAGLFARSSEPVDIEIGTAEAAEAVAPRMRGRARIDMGGEAFPTEVPAVVRFFGVGPLEYPEGA
jgi:hypothetical protein